MSVAQLLRTAGPPRAQTAECARWSRASAEYPAELLDLPNAPDLLFALGSRSTLDVPRVAIVGTRDCSGYGDRTARKIAAAIARALRYTVNLIGVEHVALGSDFDGARIPAVIGDVGGVQNLVEAMRGHGFDETTLGKLCCDNWIAVLERSWKSG